MSEWISCKDSTPARHRLVLASDGVDMYFAIFNGDYWFHEGYAMFVTHWMELPEPPK